MLGRMFKTRLDEKKVTKKLAGLNTELALQMIALASETGDKEPLIEAVKSLRASEALFQPETTPVENAQLHKKLGDVLMKIGKDEQDMEALDYAIIAYRGAITISSLLGETRLRTAARKNYALAKNLRGIHEPKANISLMGAA